MMIRNKKSARGFTLTEIAVVLGIVAVMLGGIWVAGGRVRNNMRIAMATREAQVVVTGMRAIYGGKALFDSGSLTNVAVNAGLFPSDLVVKGLPQNPWFTNDGTEGFSESPGMGFSVGSNVGWAIQCNALKSQSVLEIVYWGLPKDACIQVMSHFIGANATPDIVCAYSDGMVANPNITNPSAMKVSDLAGCGGNVVIYFKK